ncbi:hypothetical protein LTR53_002195 [Teratosphaeriaceae sp. CCFEE 6253]|nr:hypothetical protein LTR53_002195 [Teratosphaeriaceae sp. CCFEE 6253]
MPTSYATVSSSSAGGIANNATMTLATPAIGSYAPYLPAGAGPSSNAIGAVGATSSASMGIPMASGNGTVTAPSASVLPYTGAGTTQEVD